MRLENLTPANNRFLHDQHRFIVTSAGRRSRKTLIGDTKLLTDPGRGAFEVPEFAYILGAPTRPQAKDIFWERLKKDTKLFRYKASETELRVWLINGSIITVAGMDKPERIEGQTNPPIKGVHLTEMGNMKPGLFDAHIRPVLSDTNGFAIIDGVPEGRDDYYDMALNAAGGVFPKTVPKQGAYGENGAWSWHTWFSSDILPASDLLEAKNTMDARTYRQEFEGSFEDLQGVLYYAYGAHNAIEGQYDPSQLVHIGMDFNVDPMTAVFSQIYGDEIYVFGEAYLNHSNTMEMRDHINELFNYKQCIIYPDSTGRAEESNAQQSDLAILTKAGFTVRAHSINPRRKNRIASVNSLLMSQDGTVRMRINIKNCPKLVNDLNKVQATSDGREDKTQEKEGLVHISSALGYMCAYKFPVKDRMFQ